MVAARGAGLRFVGCGDFALWNRHRGRGRRARVRTSVVLAGSTGNCAVLVWIAAIVAFVVGVFVMRAATLRAGALDQSLEQLPQGPARDAQLAQVQALRRRAAISC